ncbi:hypothetical protein MOX02_13070 [Methylobacterium oxalidis]|uniref:Uncharacterized protein n=1 Tax=Methylobacterium oxalidis TaxID=944322 RepID=A0A512J074_9HYPH|nr:hypothetical protein MOX02_13070 [Methylobacterium oxalidis]GLS64225.1 hypothetical protein GCM10007888_26060 [Methylobacterium oxalidis]
MVRASILPDGVTAPVTRGRSNHERRNRASSSSGSRRSRTTPVATMAFALERRNGGKTEVPRIGRRVNRLDDESRTPVKPRSAHGAQSADLPGGRGAPPHDR